MLARSLIFAGIAAVAAIQAPSFFSEGQKPTTQPDLLLASQTEQPATPAAALPSGSVRLAANAQGHYSGTFKFNGRPVTGMIDTGATYVALNESVARSLGYSGNQLNFSYSVNTANGNTKAAHIVLNRIEIGSIRVRDVDAFVLKDDALQGTLVGVSFLQKLGSYAVADGSLNLKQ